MENNMTGRRKMPKNLRLALERLCGRGFRCNVRCVGQASWQVLVFEPESEEETLDPLVGYLTHYHRKDLKKDQMDRLGLSAKLELFEYKQVLMKAIKG